MPEETIIEDPDEPKLSKNDIAVKKKVVRRSLILSLTLFCLNAMFIDTWAFHFALSLYSHFPRYMITSKLMMMCMRKYSNMRWNVSLFINISHAEHLCLTCSKFSPLQPLEFDDFHQRIKETGHHIGAGILMDTLDDLVC